MNEFYLPFANWRILTLEVLSMFAAIALLSTHDELYMFFLVKAFGFFLLAAIVFLFKKWRNTDSMKGINDLIKEED